MRSSYSPKPLHLFLKAAPLAIWLLLPTVVIGQKQDPILATLNGRSISQSEVDATLVSQLLPLEQQVYALRRAALDNLITRMVLEEEARKRSVTLEELRRQLTAGTVQVTTDQVEALYLENVSAFAAMSPDEARERLRLDLESQARMRNYRTALEALKRANRIESYLEEPRVPVLAGTNSPSVGPADAPVTIVEFSDFQCPYCREAQTTVKRVLANYKADVRLVFKHLPLQMHAQAFVAAQAAFCAGEQNRFWPFHDSLFASTDLSAEALKKVATSVGLDSKSFETCLADQATRSVILSDLNEAQRLGINSTPTFIVNGRLIRGVATFETFKAAIDRELQSFRAKRGSTAAASQERQ